jgi:hypothetical protein
LIATGLAFGACGCGTALLTVRINRGDAGRFDRHRHAFGFTFSLGSKFASRIGFEEDSAALFKARCMGFRRYQRSSNGTERKRHSRARKPSSRVETHGNTIFLRALMRQESSSKD